MNDSQSHMTAEKHVDILMKEYETLRSEIIQRIGHRISFLGLFGAVIGYLAFRLNELKAVEISALLFAILFLFAIWMQLGHLISQCSARIAEIESQINGLVGKSLLMWETRNRTNLLNLVHLGRPGHRQGPVG
jgi:tetrahydromethanopterin S-methyltransferase subunit G